MTRMERRQERRRIASLAIATAAILILVIIAVMVTVCAGTGEVDSTRAKAVVELNIEPKVNWTEEVAELDVTDEPVEEAVSIEPECLSEEIPLDYDLQMHLKNVCDSYEIPYEIVLGVIQLESAFTPSAQNGKCYGLMQISTVNSKRLEEIGVTDLKDPYQNIISGAFMLSELYGKYGDWNKALTCYNYGERGAKKKVFDLGYISTGYSRTVLKYAEKWAEVLENG